LKILIIADIHANYVALLAVLLAEPAEVRKNTLQGSGQDFLTRSSARRCRSA
jgi:hypothetical protein